ncbi:aminotransferase class I/II-fold pyridoxal phosphate-dependent enzyme [Paeniglutamicibacter cryotolerans]|uniref:cysteine-S-conjugate beta-lyase n=2 Tax=Paeniglutamicibacter cryotolerans TaxID=670079 RepID=A0A839QMH2_9MICC|nr:cystathionine beta-lyase [Paeniglutamicibacter cryotolerans]
MDAHPFDRITVDELRRGGSLKWTGQQEALGAWIAEMDFGTAPGVLEAAAQTIASGLVGYAPAYLVSSLQEATADWLDARFGWRLDPAQIRPLSNVGAAFDAAIMHFSPAHRPDAPVVLLTPAYMPFIDTPARFGRRSIQVPMLRTGIGWELDWAGLESALSGGALLVLVNPHNPIGKVYTRAELLRISRLVEHTGSRVFADEIHAPLVYGGYEHHPYAAISDTAAGHSITGISASKAFNIPGLKCAQLVLTNDADRTLWARVGIVPEHGAATPGLAGTAAAYDGGQAWLGKVLGYLEGNRDLLGGLVAEHLPRVRYLAPQGTYLAWLDVSELGLGPDPVRFFRQQAQLALTDGALCGQAGRGFVRLNFATPRPVLAGMLHRMGASIDGPDQFDEDDPEYSGASPSF